MFLPLPIANPSCLSANVLHPTTRITYGLAFDLPALNHGWFRQPQFIPYQNTSVGNFYFYQALDG